VIGICTPYTWADSTYMAIGLSDYAIKLGLNVDIRPIRVSDTGVHSSLDSKVLKQKSTAFKPWASNKKCIVWFEPQPKNMITAKKLGCKNILVINQTSLPAYPPSYLDSCEYVLTPTEYMADSLRALWRHSGIYGIPWDVGLPVMLKTKRVDPKNLWLYVPIQSAAATAFGSKIFFALQFLLEARDDLKVTVSYSKRLSREASAVLSDISKRFGDRVIKLRKPTYQKRLASYANHDWTFWAHQHDPVGVVPLESLCSGTPVVTFSTSVMAEVIEHSRNGHLIKSPLAIDPLGIPITVDASPKSLIEGLQSSVLDATVLNTLHRHDWPDLESRRRSFQAVWKTLWGLR
jgi:hypothetical protein